MSVIAVSLQGGVARVALLQGNRLEEYSLWYFNRAGDIGDVYVARVTARVPAMAGSFVDLGGESGFLPDSSAPGGLSEGSYFISEISRCAQSGKGPRVKALSGPASDKPGLIRQSLGPLADLGARHPEAPIQIDDHALLATIISRSKASSVELKERMSYRAGIFDCLLEEEVAALAEPSIDLPGGARMHITPTPALTAIDIDMASATAGRLAKSHAQPNLNAALIPEIARQIRLRNLSGPILLDFAGMKPTARRKLLPDLEEALKTDPLKPRCLGLSRAGFAEIIRSRIRPPLHECLQ